MPQINSVNIRPGVNVLSVLPHLNYKAWFALAEFVDNSIQSSIDRRRALQVADGGEYVLGVDIYFDPIARQITIVDNAGGIASKDYQRAFRPAEIPLDATGLSEFGMGMKSAACWFAPNWSVRSSPLGEGIERTVFFDIGKIVEDSSEELNVVSTVVSEGKHYTEVRLENIRRFPKGRTVEKVKKHLASIYRIFVRDGLLNLYVNGDKLTYEDPKILVAPSFENLDSPPIEWKRKINIDLGEGKSAEGFVAIREKGSTALAGLAIFRRNRLILGSVDETYRPKDIFGSSTTRAYQRLFGEIHLKGFYVSHTKDGIKWEEKEEEFLKTLRSELQADAMPILQQVRNYTTKSDAKANQKAAGEVLQSTAAQLGRHATLAFRDAASSGSVYSAQDAAVSSDQETDLAPLSSKERECAEFNLAFRGEPWIVKIELSYADNEPEWLAIKNLPGIADPEPREVVIRIAMLHPFMVQFPNLESEGLSAVLGIAASMGLAEVVAAELAERNPAVIRRFTGEILRNRLSRPVNDE